MRMLVDADIEFVKSQIDHHRKSITFHEKRQDQPKVNRHRGILRRFEDLLPKLEHLIGLPISPSSDLKEVKIGSRIGNIDDLPEAIRAQLVSFQMDELEAQILDLLNDKLDRVATIDEILVGLWRSHAVEHQREQLANKIYRMTRKEQLFSVSGKKGVYSTLPVEEADDQKAADDQ
jgi:hypothetical protein